MPGANCPSTGCCRRSSDDGRPAAVRPPSPPCSRRANGERPAARARPDRPHPASPGLRRTSLRACTRPCRTPTRCRRRPLRCRFRRMRKRAPRCNKCGIYCNHGSYETSFEAQQSVAAGAYLYIYTGGLYARWIYGGGLSGCRVGFFAACVAAFVNGSAPARALICNSLRPPANAATAWANGNPDDPRRAPGSAPRQPAASLPAPRPFQKKDVTGAERPKESFGSDVIQAAGH